MPDALTTNAIPTTTRVWMQTAPLDRNEKTNVEAIKKCIHLEEGVPIPQLKPQQLLIKVERCTINPNELLHLFGTYGVTEDIPYPRPVGFEGSGTVVASTASWYFAQVGQTVSFYADKGGAHGDYVVVNADSAIPFDATKVSFSRAAASMVNPLTAITMVDYAISKGHKIFVHTAAASTLGRLLWKYAQKRGVEIIHVVRKQEQVDLLKKELGATHVLNSSTESFAQDLKALMAETKCTFMYDAVSGEVMPETLLRASPPGSTLAMYGSLAADYTKVSLSALFNKRTIECFLVSEYLDTLWFWSVLNVISKVKAWMTEEAEADNATGIKVRKAVPLEQLPELYAEYNGPNMTAGKLQTMGASQSD